MTAKAASASALVVGASAGLGRALANKLGEAGYNVILVARDEDDLTANAKDIEIRFQVRTFTIACDLLNPEFNAANLLNLAKQAFGQVNEIYLVAGGSFEADHGLPSSQIIWRSLQLNYTAIAQLMAEAVQTSEQLGCKSILVVSSIAAPVARARNAAYSASKAALESFAKSMRHHCSQTNNPLRIKTLRLGYMDSIFTYGKRLAFPVVKPDDVAGYIVRQTDKDDGLSHFPQFWFWIVFVLKSLPWPVYRRLKF